MREKLSTMESAGYIEHGGTGRGAYWCIQPELYNRLAEDGQSEARRRIGWEAAKTRVLSILMERARRNEPGLSNKDIRQITRFDRNQARRLMQELMQENASLQKVGERRWARYEYSNAREH
jgi:ATP-dependent DNA helicase RecG